ncbi:FAD:protein FMN transferase [Brevibacillus daliensis]|uniref:FAD:protein FMN transferase n=1 Tax=Brevibacillus daliensis TaxID=2892995 RepID=UPI001E36F5DF|nr:FAD:protein FMN transferase [Brevibacillus daliensis]
MKERSVDYSEYQKYNDSFFESFDTVTQVVAYTKSEEEFKKYFNQIKARFQELHRLYDIFNNYEGVNNIKTINDQAGIRPVKVDQEIIDLLQFSNKWYVEAGEETNIAMGSVLEIWQTYRDEALSNPAVAKLPPMEELKAAAQHMDMDKVIIDTANSTVFLEDPEMSLNVGSVAKGFATELVANEMKEAGLESAIISAGGNVRTIGYPYDSVRNRWGIGIQNPDRLVVTDEENLLDTAFIQEASVVSSGDYQRYYEVDNKRIHHLIDPKTLMPGDYYRAVTIVTADSGLADFLSTVVFLTPYEESRAFVDRLEGVEALWVMQDGTVKATQGMETILKSKGASGK